MKLSNIRLLVNNFDKCFTFYNSTIGLECTWGKPGENFASFNLGLPSGLAIFKAGLMDIAINKPATEKKEIFTDKAVIVIEVENVDETYKELKSKGVQFLNEPKDMAAWGIRVTHFRDPENNLIELHSLLVQ
jgi:lactoylglutathione lyase